MQKDNSKIPSPSGGAAIPSAPAMKRISGELRLNFRHLDLITAAFSVVLVVSNIASSAKIIDWGVSLFGIRFSFDAGTLLFPISYIFGDIFTEVYGFKASRKVIWTGFGLLIFSSLIFFIVQHLPGEAEWESYAGDKAYNSILGGMNSGGIVLASLLGYLAGEFSNSKTLSLIKVLMNGKLLFVRTISSTLVGELFDSIIFIGVAILMGVFPATLFMSLFLTNYIFKCLMEVVLTPVTYLVVGVLKKAEGVDVFDVPASAALLRNAA